MLMNIALMGLLVSTHIHAEGQKDRLLGVAPRCLIGGLAHTLLHLLPAVV